MIVDNKGYKNLDQVLEMANNGAVFAIYSTRKKTEILVQSTSSIYLWDRLDLYKMDFSRYPWKVIEGKKIKSNIKKVISSDDLSLISTKNWNGRKQIMTYEEFNY